MAAKKETKKKEEAVDTIKSIPLIEKLFEIEHEIEFIKKDTKGHNYTYASPSKVLGILRPLLKKYRVKLEQNIVDVKYDRIFSKPNAKGLLLTDEQTGKPASKQVRFDVYETLISMWFEMTWVNVDNPEDTRTVPFFAQGANGDDKGVGSAMTYAERYFILKYFNIPTDDDDPDWLANKLEPKKAQPAPPPPPAPKQQTPPPAPKPEAKKPLDDVTFSTMIKYVGQGKGDQVVSRLQQGYTYTEEQYNQLVKAGMQPFK